MCCNVFNVWAKTTFLPVWPRNEKGLDTHASVTQTHVGFLKTEVESGSGKYC